MKTLTFWIIGMLVYLQPAFTQIPEVTWEKTLPVRFSHYFSDIYERADGNFIVLGAIYQSGDRNYDIWLLELNSNGDTLKTKVIESAGKDIPMRILSFGNTGYLLSYLNETGENSYKSRLMAVGPDFKELWKTEAEKIAAIPRSDFAADDAGNIWWMNTVSGADGKPQVTLCKLDAKGNTAKELAFSGTHPAEGYAARVLPDESLALSLRVLPPDEKSFVQVIRTDGEGEVMWKAIIPDATKSLTPQCLCCASDNTLLVGGWAALCYNPDSPPDEQIWDYDYLLSKIDASGKILWSQNYNREGSEMGTAVAVLPDGNIMAAGKCETSFTGSIGPWLLLVDKNGNKVKDQVYRFRFVKDQVARIICTQDGGFLMVGPGYIETDNQLTGWLRKLNPLM